MFGIYALGTTYMLSFIFGYAVIDFIYVVIMY